MGTVWGVALVSATFQSSLNANLEDALQGIPGADEVSSLWYRKMSADL